MSLKKPISQRGTAAPINMDDIFGNALGIPPELAKEIEDDGKVFRFINTKRLGDMGGYHPQGWVPYKPKARANIEGQALLHGNDPSGYIRRGDCVLAVRPKELNEKHKLYLKQESDRTSTANVQKKAAASVREFARANGLDLRVQEGAEVHEGFDNDKDFDE